MDESSIIIGQLIDSLGVEQTELLFAFVVISLICRIVGKLIPDNATGWQGVVRKITKVIGLYVTNRVVENHTSILSLGRDAKGKFLKTKGS